MAKFLTIKVRILLTFAFLSSLSFYYFYDWVIDTTRRHYLEAAEEVMVDQLILLKSIIEIETADGDEFPNVKKITSFYDDINHKKYSSAKIYSIFKNNTDQSVYLTDRHGLVIFHSREKGEVGENYSIWRNVALALSGKYGARSTRSIEKEPRSSILHVSYPIEKKGKIIGSVTLVKPVSAFTVLLENSQKEVSQIAMMTFLLLMLCGFLLIKKIVYPIESLTRYTEATGKGEKVALPKLRASELRILGETIAEMQKNLDGKKYIESYINSLTHELKSPIAAIKGAVELLDGDLKQEETQKLLKNIDRETERMSKMINNLLLLSRLENFEASQQLADADLSKLLKEVVEEFKSRFFDRELRIHCEEIEKISIDKQLLKVAISNLLSNAIDFSEDLIELKLFKTGKEIVIEVSDSGVGIPEYALPKIKDKFFSLPRPKSGIKSSGLGLAIVEEIMAIHQGYMRIENKMPKGVVVKLIFPVN